MSNDVIISVEGLGKKYRIAHQAERQRYTALRDVLADKTKSVGKRLWSAFRPPSFGAAPSSILHPPSSEDFWALRDVSFSVRRGEVVGIIGRNGAGKSTLLKILSRITEPTEGRVRIKGRVASLLEVGTGFHPELTGRENIFLNGAILGMHRAEIRKKFDEIVAFAEVEKFLDTPVKRYSSGMYVRLAFAVAAHLEPEILIVDEVLAVGDAEFQKKCLGKMESVARSEGRTVLFVSHNMAAVQSLTKRSLLLVGGCLHMFDSTDAVVAAYQRKVASEIGARHTRIGGSGDRIERLELKADGVCTDSVPMGASLCVELSYRHVGNPEEAVVGIGINNYSGTRIVSVDSLYDSGHYIRLSGHSVVVCDFGRLPLNPGLYQIKLGLATSRGVILEDNENVMSFEVVEADVHKKGFSTQVQKGVFFWIANWKHAATTPQPN